MVQPTLPRHGRLQAPPALLHQDPLKDLGFMRSRGFGVAWLIVLSVLCVAGGIGLAFYVVANATFRMAHLPTPGLTFGTLCVVALAGLLSGTQSLVVIATAFRHDLPSKRAMLGAIALGSTVVCAAAVLLHGGALGLATFAQDLNSSGNDSWRQAENLSVLSTVLFAPIIEEGLKFGAVFLVYMVWPKSVSSVARGAVIGGAVGAGFALSEDAMYTFAAAITEELGAQGPLVATFVTRVVLSGMIHTLFTAGSGAALGWVLGRRNVSFMVRITWTLLGLAAAMAAHAFWNGTQVLTQNALAGLIFLAVLLPLYGLAIALLYVAGALNRRRIGRIWRGSFAPPLAALMLTPGTAQRSTFARIQHQRRRITRGVQTAAATYAALSPAGRRSPGGLAVAHTAFACLERARRAVLKSP